MVDQTTPQGGDNKVIFVTREGLQKLKEELAYLENVKRKEIAERIKEAVSYGDLSENSEYEEAKNEQAFVEGRILVLNEQVKYAQVIEDEHSHQKVMTVQLGSKVTIKTLSGQNKGEKFEYLIVGTTEADPFNMKISNESPIGIALLERKVGEIVEVKAPIGLIKYEILKIE